MEAAPTPIKRRRINYGKSLLKVFVLIVLASLCLTGLTFLFQWTDISHIPPHSGALCVPAPVRQPVPALH